MDRNGAQVVVRRITTDDHVLAKRLRLAALEEAPDAFRAHLGDERAMPESVWRERVASNAEGVRTVGFFAVIDGREQGLVIGVYDGTSGIAELVSLWVEPTARGRGAGGALIEAVCAWARDRGCHRVVLSVLDVNETARTLYRARGFVDTGEREPSTPAGSMWLLEMARDL